MAIAGENPMIAMIHDLRRVWRWCDNGKILIGAVGLALACCTPMAAFRFDVRSFGMTPVAGGVIPSGVSEHLAALAWRAVAREA